MGTTKNSPGCGCCGSDCPCLDALPTLEIDYTITFFDFLIGADRTLNIIIPEVSRTNTGVGGDGCRINFLGDVVASECVDYYCSNYPTYFSGKFFLAYPSFFLRWNGDDLQYAGGFDWIYGQQSNTGAPPSCPDPEPAFDYPPNTLSGGRIRQTLVVPTTTILSGECGNFPLDVDYSETGTLDASNSIFKHPVFIGPDCTPLQPLAYHLVDHNLIFQEA